MRVWAERASEAAKIKITAVACPAGLVHLAVEGAGCDYEVRKKGGFQRTPTDTFGVSPIVNLQWGDAPEPMKKGLSTVLSALTKDPSLTVRDAPGTGRAQSGFLGLGYAGSAAALAVVAALIGALFWLRRPKPPAPPSAGPS